MNAANENLFENYFSGQLNNTDKAIFENRLKDEKDLAQDFQFFLAVKKATHLKGRDKLRNELNSITEESTSISKVIPLWKKLIPLAAIFLLALIAYKMNSSEMQVVDQYAQHFEPYSPSTNRSIEIKNLAIEKYVEGDYQRFLDVTKSIEGDSEVYMLQAMAFIQLNDYNKADERLQLIDDGSSLRNQKYWYLALNAIKRNNSEDAIRYFEHLQSISNYKKAEIKEILDQLKNQ